MSLIARRPVPLGELITKYRAEHDMSLRAFSRAAGLSATYISMIEKGENSRGSIPMPSIDTYKAIAKAMGMSLKELIRIVDVDEYNPNYVDEVESFEEQKNDKPELDPELAALLEDLRTREDMRMLFKLAHDATPDDVRAAVKIIEALRKE